MNTKQPEKLSIIGFINTELNLPSKLLPKTTGILVLKNMSLMTASTKKLSMPEHIRNSAKREWGFVL